MPDAFFGEELLAVVIPKQGEQVTEQELREFCRVPKQREQVTEQELREQAIKVLGLEDVANIRTA